MDEKYFQESDLRKWVEIFSGIWPTNMGETYFQEFGRAVLCWGMAAGGGCSSTALHRHDQLAKYHPVPWLRWPNVSWHQVFHLPEPIVSLIIMHLSWIYRESMVDLSWIYREPIPDANSFFQFEELHVWKSWNLVWNGSIWLGMSSY